MVNRTPNNQPGPTQNAGIIPLYFVPLSLFLFAFVYFFFVANPLLFFQEQRTLFVSDGRFINPFFLKPGGLLELMGKFITQFYAYRFVGSVIVAALFSSVALLMVSIHRKLRSGRTFSIVFSLLPACLLLLLQSHYYHYMEFNLGFLMVLVYCWFSGSEN